MSIVKLGRAIALAAAIIVAPGILDVAGPPMWAALRDVAFNLAALRSEAEHKRQKMSGAATRARMANAQMVGTPSAVHPNGNLVAWQSCTEPIRIARPAWRRVEASHPISSV
jgi:hypothetical protein